MSSPSVVPQKRPASSMGDAIPEIHEQVHGFPTPPGTASPKTSEYVTHPSTVRASSPALSSSTLSSLPASVGGSATATGGAVQAQSHKRRRTAEEKERDRLDKEARAREREMKKAQRDLEAANKAEERRIKNEIREEKQREKDLQKKQKEEEEAKKRRAQSRLGSFFVKTPATKEQETQLVTATDPERTQAMTGPTTEVCTASVEEPLKDYRTSFLPFEPSSHTRWRTSFHKDHAGALQKFDEAVLKDTSSKSWRNRERVQDLIPEGNPQRGLQVLSALKVMESIQNSSLQPIDLTDDSESTTPSRLLQHIGVKTIHFCEDVRPPYTASYTKITKRSQMRKLARMPWTRSRPDTNYDYDSEAEWEEPEEGEELLSDGEDEPESVGDADEMNEFLDDGDAVHAKVNRGLLTTELEPISTGICWQDESQPLTGIDMAGVALEWLLDTDHTSINPYSNSYWLPKVSGSHAVPGPATDLFGRTLVKDEAKPSRPPLHSTFNSANKVIVNSKTGEKGPIMAVASAKTPKAPIQVLSGTNFDEFKDAVDGSNLTKIELIKALRQRFPRFNLETIKETLNSNFARVGASAAEKKWRAVAI